jgi:hypothetical protein
MTDAETGWRDPRFLADAGAWVEARLADAAMRPVGPAEQIHDRPWSTVLRVPTDHGHVFFKASAPASRHEAAVTDFLARRRPDVVPPLLAIDPALGWMLMTDGGERLREVVSREHDVSRWLDILPLYAGLQADLADAGDELVALGVPDLRLATLPARYDALLDDLDASAGPPGELDRLRDAVPRVAAMAEELAAYGIPESIEHDDLHDAAVYVHDGRYRILDWGDACVAHPFFSLSVTLEGVVAWGPDDIQDTVDTAAYRDAYLAAYSAASAASRIPPVADLRAACVPALRLGWVCRAVNGHIGGEDAASTRRRLCMFLDGRL